MPDASFDQLPRAKRQHVLLGAEVTYADGTAPTRHRVKDLSTAGARIDRAGQLTPQSLVLITVGALEAVGATVVWVKNDVAGIQFVGPIDVNAARSKALVASVTPPEDGVARFVPRPSVGQPDPSPTAGWASGLRNPYRR